VTILAEALAVLAREPSREHAAAALRALALHDADEVIVTRVLATVADRVMRALATTATITFDTPRIGELFVRLPKAVRRGFEISLVDNVTWDGRCPRCDGDLESRKDSSGGSTYTRMYRCSDCTWFGDQGTGEITMAEAYSQLAEHASQDRVAKIVASATAGDCWPLRGFPFESSDPLPPPIAALRYTSIHEIGGAGEHVVLDADELLASGRDLLARAPIRSMTLLDAQEHLVEILRSPEAHALTGLALAVTYDTPTTDVIDALLTTSEHPTLRHLRIDGVSFVRKEIEALVEAPIARNLGCLHASLRGVIEETDDYASVAWLNDHGRALLALAAQRPFLAPTVELLREIETRR
jgi:hypothetical protein